MSCKPCQKAAAPDTIGGLIFKHDSNDLLNFMDQVQKASKTLEMDVAAWEKDRAAKGLAGGLTGTDSNALVEYLYGVREPVPDGWKDGDPDPPWADPDPALRRGWFWYYTSNSPVGWRTLYTEKIWNETQNYDGRLIELYDRFAGPLYGIKMSQPRPKLGSADPNAEKSARDTAAGIGDALETGFKLALFVGGLWLAKGLIGGKKE